MIDPETLDWEKSDGLLPAIVQDASSGAVLMLGYMNREALEASLETGRVTFFSRSRRKLWTKGETSGHVLHLVDALADCDRDTILVRAKPHGPTCHRGTRSCFADDSDFAPLEILGHLEKVIRSRQQELPAGSYTTSLFEAGTARIAQKVGEEAVELLISAMQERQRTIEESADLLYHMLVFLADRDVALEDVMGELQNRHGLDRTPDSKTPNSK